MKQQQQQQHRREGALRASRWKSTRVEAAVFARRRVWEVVEYFYELSGGGKRRPPASLSWNCPRPFLFVFFFFFYAATLYCYAN